MQTLGHGPDGNRRERAALIGNGGSDALYGQTGNDQLFARDGLRDILSCSDGTDSAVTDSLDAMIGDGGCESVYRG